MKDQVEQAQLIASLMAHPGWNEFMAIAKEHIEQHRASVQSMMEDAPDKLTGKTAIAKCNRAKGIEDLLEDARNTLKALPRGDD